MKFATSFELDGDLIVVDTIVFGPSGQAKALLLLDTGAALTTLIPAIAESIGDTPAARIRPSEQRILVEQIAR